MKPFELQGSWIIRSSRENVYRIISDFESMPKHFPEVAKSLKIVKRVGNILTIDAKVKSFGTVFPVKMTTELLPSKGFISDNINEKLGTLGHEEFLLEDVSEGTRINYRYSLTINHLWLRLIATPLLRWYALRFWKRVFIDKLRKMLEAPEQD